MCRQNAGLLCLFFSVFLAGVSYNACAAEQLLNIPLRSDVKTGNKGVSKITFTRPGIAVYYDPAADKLAEAKTDTPRYLSFDGHPSGDGRGVLFENYAENPLLDSSFEMPDSAVNWSIEGMKKSGGGIHGKQALEVSGNKAILRSTTAVPLTPVGAHYFTPTFTAYIWTPDGKSPEKRVKPLAFAVEEDGHKQVEIFASSFAHKKYAPYEFQKVGNGNWWRMLARILEKEYGKSYYFGLEISGGTGIRIDALQLEKNSLPWTASSYIPTLDAPGKRQTY